MSEQPSGLHEAFAPLPQPPYYAVIFASTRAAGAAADGVAAEIDADGYAAMADRMVELAAGQPGFLGVDSARGADGFGLTVSYWASPEAIAAWKADAEHQVARETGRTRWYSHYTLRVARVERSYAMPRSAAAIGAPAEVGLSGTFDTPGTSGTPVASRPPAD